jgi:hypothetical protein
MIILYLAFYYAGLAYTALLLKRKIEETKQEINKVFKVYKD